VELDLNETEAVKVRPILLVVKGARSRPAVLILDNANLDHLSRPCPDDESEAIKTGFDLFVPSSLLFRQIGGQAVLLLKDGSAPALELTAPTQLTDIIRSGGQIRWRRQRTGQHARDPRRPGPRPVTLSAVLLQDVNAPAVPRLVCPDETCADEFDELMSPEGPATPYYLIDTIRMVFEPGRNGLRFRILASDDRDRPFTFEGTLGLDFIKGGPLPPDRN
jgi:hypothetical protein